MLHVSDILLTTGTMPDSSDNSSALFMTGGGTTTPPKHNCCSCRKAVLGIVSLIILTGTVGVLFYYYQPWINPFPKNNEKENTLQQYKIPTETFLLPRNVQPLRYRLKLHPNLENFNFNGHVSIHLQCIYSTNFIQLHSELLNLTKIQLTASENISVSDGGHVSQIINIDIQKVVFKESKMTIYLDKELESKRNYVLDINFSGEIGDSLNGLYRSSYLENGIKKYIATTHFQPNYARRMFPCFDEPRFKSKFEISVARRTNMTVLSNMPSKEIEPLKNATGWVWEHFMPSPLMSTYLVAVTVSDFKSLNATQTGPGPVIKIWAPKNLLANTNYAAEITPKIIGFFEIYFQTKFTLLKLDLIAIPDFAMGAMENWGLISFRDTYLLLDPETDTIEARRHIFNLVAHEIAHQWFGNLVSMDWWSELWLNEGFATYMAYLAEYKLNNDWESSFFEVLHNALEVDASKASHSINVAVTNDMDIEPIFDPIIYNKGACLLRMLSNTITETSFKLGIKDYIKIGSFNTTTEEKLWSSMERFTNISVFQIMSSWTNQPGYPLITINRDYNTSTLHIKQSKFASNSTSNWIVPITYTTKTSSKESTIFLDSASIKVKILAPRSDWLLFNLKQTGFYRVNYDLDNWNKLINNYNFIPLWSKGQMINDAFELAKYGYLGHEVVFNILKTMSFNEKKYAPWKIALNGLQFLEFVFMDTEHFGKYKNFVITFLISNYNQNEHFDVLPLDAIVLESLCRMKYKPCLVTAKNIFNLIRTGVFETNLPYNLHQTVYCTAIASGTEDVWDYVWNQTLITRGMELRNLYLALGCSNELWKVNSYIEKTLTGEIAPQNVMYVWRSLARNPSGRLIALAYLEDNWNKVYNVYKHKFSMLKSIVEEFFQHLSSEADYKKVLNLYIKNKTELKPVASYFKTAIEAIKMKIDWKKKYLQQVLSLL